MRMRTLVLLAVLVTVLPVWVTAAARGGRGQPDALHTPVPGASRSAAEVRALGVLHRWDVLRAAAWSGSDPVALGRLYLPGSRTGGRDVHDLRRWASRGLRVTGLRQQVSEVRVIRSGPWSMVVTVTERTIDGIAVGRAEGVRRTAVPVSGWATHRISLRRVAGGWRVGEVGVQPAR